MKAHKMGWYREWHQWKLHHHFHVAVLVFYIASIFLGVLGAFLPGGSLAATKSWDFRDDSIYNVNPVGEITVGGGTASLGSHTPSTDWIATDVNNWINRRVITITNPNGSSAFQVKLSGLDTQQNGKMHYDGTDCEDLRFTSSDKVTVIPHWVESASCNSASTDVWVKVPQSVPTIYMYYNNSNEALTSTSSDTAVFEKVIGNLQGAWTMDETSGTNVADYHNSHNPGDPNDATATNTTIVDGNNGRGKARNFNGANPATDLVTLTDTDNSLDTASGTNGKVTVSAWIYLTTDNGTHRPILQKGTNPNYRFRVNSNETLNFSYANAGWRTWASTGTVSYNTWQHVAVSVTTNASQSVSGIFYINGVSAGTFAGLDNVPMLQNNDSTQIGYWAGLQGYLGTIDEPRVYMNNLALEDIQAMAVTDNDSYFSPSVHAGTEYIKKYTPSVSAGAAGSEEGYYHNDYPTIQNQESGNGVSLSYISVMNITTTGNVRFQITPDNGATWYRWNGSAWVAVTDPDNYAENKTSLPGDLTANIDKFRPGGANPRNFRWRAFLVSDGSQTATITDISITYQVDTTAPQVLSSGNFTCYTDSTETTQWTYETVPESKKWRNFEAPKFVWTPPSDTGDPDSSGVWRYYVALTTNSGYTPTESDTVTYEPDPYYQVSSGNLTNGQKYYLRVVSVDNAGNPSTAVTTIEYWYDSTLPSNPTNLQVNTLQPTDEPLSFSWDASTDSDPDGAGQLEASGVDHYEYKKGAISGWQSTANTFVDNITGDEDGNNTFRVKAVDKAGNPSGEVTIVYSYILNAPSQPQNIRVTEQSRSAAVYGNSANNFEFSWDAPNYAEPPFSVAGYEVFVNELPSANPQNDYTYINADNKNDIGNALTINNIRAAQQNVNRFYVVAYDSDNPSKINYSNYASIDFQIDTASIAPTAPQTVVISDVSDRHKPDHYALALSWKLPSNYSANTFGRYNIRRATSLAGLANDSDWLARPPDGTTSTPAYAEAGLTKDQMYYYRVSGEDNAGAEVALSEIVAKAPTGKYIEPPTDTPPSVSVTATSATVTWTTDRISYSKVEYGKAPSYGMQNSSLQTANNHSVTLYGLDPGTTYHYRTQSLDPSDQEDYDDSLAYSEDLTFATQPAPGISDVKISDIRLDSALVTWKTTSSAVSTLKYGKTNSYGKEISDSSGSAVTTHTVKLSGLDHSSTYHFKLFGTDTDGNVMQSDDYNFDTLTFPKVSNVNFQQMKGTATSTMKVTWESNVPVSSVVLYTDPTGKTMEAAQSELETKHEMIISGLKDNTEYTLAVKGRDAYGNEGSSGSEKVKTDFDTRPPLISEITTETSINGYGASAKSQLVVSWYTDEPATSQVEYAKGVTGDTFTMSTKEDAMLTTSHVVVVSDLDPSSAYYFRVVSKDNSKNEAKSETNSALTEQARSSIFDLVLKSFESTLGWLFGGK